MVSSTQVRLQRHHGWRHELQRGVATVKPACVAVGGHHAEWQQPGLDGRQYRFFDSRHGPQSCGRLWWPAAPSASPPAAIWPLRGAQSAKSFSALASRPQLLGKHQGRHRRRSHRRLWPDAGQHQVQGNLALTGGTSVHISGPSPSPATPPSPPATTCTWAQGQVTQALSLAVPRAPGDRCDGGKQAPRCRQPAARIRHRHTDELRRVPSDPNRQLRRPGRHPRQLRQWLRFPGRRGLRSRGGRNAERHH